MSIKSIMKKTTNTKNYIKYQVYDAVVYPIKLVVAMTDGGSDETSELNDVFTPKTDISINGNDAITFPAVLNEDSSSVVGVILHGPQPDNVWVHEADHFANMLFCLLGISLELNNDEAHAYLVEWAFQCIKDFCQAA